MAIYVCTQFDLVLLSVEFFAAYLQFTVVRICTMCRAECKASKKVILTKDQKRKESLAFTRTSKNMLGVILVNLLHSEAILDCKNYHIFV